MLVLIVAFYILYHILPVNSHSYYKFQVEMGVATNQDVYIKIARKV